MKIQIIAVGKIKNKCQSELIFDYLSKVPYQISIKELEINKKLPPESLMKHEAEEITKHIPKNSKIIVLDVAGKRFTSKDFATEIHKSANNTIIIGGAYGIDPIIKKIADCSISLSDMTFAHKIARIMLAEQIYRAYTINNNHPYDK